MKHRADVTITRREILEYIEENEGAFTNRYIMSEQTGVSIRTIARHLKALRLLGVIEIDNRNRGGSRYRIIANEQSTDSAKRR